MQRLIGAFNKLETAMDSEDVTCVVSIFTDDARYAPKFKKLPLRQIARKLTILCHLKMFISVAIMSHFKHADRMFCLSLR